VNLSVPPDLSDTTASAWFDRLADRLLKATRLHIHGQRYRLTEVEVYYHSAAHPDPYAHRNPIQRHTGRWYFHRTGGQYRGGSFKGLDVTFGDGVAHGGILFRGMEKPDGSVVDGPSLLVDELLNATRFRTVATLDAALGERLAWDTDSPMSLVPWEGEPQPVWKSIRVGLSLKRFPFHPEDPAIRFLFRHYRYLTEPRRTKKGKPHLVLPLLADGMSAEKIHRITGCPLATVQRYATEFAAGRGEVHPEPYYGIDLGTKELCRLYGLRQRG
jgi:hypothetical protein